MTTWEQVTSDRYWEMLEVLPPACMTGLGFLVGEPMDHNAEGRPRFSAFVEIDGTHYEADEPMTIRDFRAINPQEVHS